MKRQTFIVGDVHGCFQEFLALLKKLDYHRNKHRLILVGDIIGKGPHSLEVLEWVKEQAVEMVRGNHEQAFIKGVKENKLSKHPLLEKLKQDMKDKLDDWIKWLEKTPLYIEEEDFLVVHAGLVPETSPALSKPHLLMNIRTWDRKGKNIKSNTQPAWHKFYKGEKLVVYGHWGLQGLQIKENSIGLDTGCVYGNQLTGVLLPEQKILQVPALKNYYKTLKNTTN